MLVKGTLSGGWRGAKANNGAGRDRFVARIAATRNIGIAKRRAESRAHIKLSFEVFQVQGEIEHVFVVDAFEVAVAISVGEKRSLVSDRRCSQRPSGQRAQTGYAGLRQKTTARRRAALHRGNRFRQHFQYSKLRSAL